MLIGWRLVCYNCCCLISFEQTGTKRCMDLHLLLHVESTPSFCPSPCSTSLRGTCPSSGSEPFLRLSCLRQILLCCQQVQFSPQTSTRTFYGNRYVVIREVHVCTSCALTSVFLCGSFTGIRLGNAVGDSHVCGGGGCSGDSHNLLHQQHLAALDSWCRHLLHPHIPSSGHCAFLSCDKWLWCFHGLRHWAAFKDSAGREHRRSSCYSSASWLLSARRRLCPEGPRQDVLHALHFSEHLALLLVKFPPV